MDWKPPTTVQQIWSFLGLAGYYRRFILDFSRIAKPMTELLKKGVKFEWSQKCVDAFHALRQHLTTAPVLAQPDNPKSFDIYCDASGDWVVFLCKTTELLPTHPEHSGPMSKITPHMIWS
jgi:hypothetical protein